MQRLGASSRHTRAGYRLHPSTSRPWGALNALRLDSIAPICVLLPRIRGGRVGEISWCELSNSQPVRKQWLRADMGGQKKREEREEALTASSTMSVRVCVLASALDLCATLRALLLALCPRVAFGPAICDDGPRTRALTGCSTTCRHFPSCECVPTLSFV